nr:spider venom peptide 1 [Neoseiulus barkeri]
MQSSVVHIQGCRKSRQQALRCNSRRRSISRRSCLRRGQSCDARPHDCCEYSSCRCNFWGTNCRCQRAGLLQRLG